MKLANEDVTMLAFTSEEITAPFLLPEMVNLTLYLKLLPARFDYPKFLLNSLIVCCLSG